MFKYSVDDILPYLLKLFNSIFSSGVYPATWTKSTIVPIYKTRSYHSADNHRGISLTSVFSKNVIGVLNDRLNVWSNMNKIITEELVLEKDIQQ